MELLLDTHAFLWWDAADGRLGTQAASVIADPENRVFVSAASIWEIVVKRALGRLAFTGSPREAVRRNEFEPLAISAEDAEATSLLPPLHRDPFDRILIAQAQLAGLVLVTADAEIERYDVARLAAR